jgi:IS4 transposase
VLSFVQAWDGMVSCLRTRSFEETSRLTERALGKKASLVGERNTGVVGERIVVTECGEWKVLGVRRLQTWPFGYMNTFLARK